MKHNYDPVYEHLKPNQCYIMFATKKGIMYATNKKGVIKLKWAKMPK